MNFYIGNRIEDINVSDENVCFDDNLLDYIDSMREKTNINFSPLIAIDPYDDVVLSDEDITSMIDMCEAVLKSEFLNQYAEKEFAKKEFNQFIEFGKTAISEGKGLISIGD